MYTEVSRVGKLKKKNQTIQLLFKSAPIGNNFRCHFNRTSTFSKNILFRLTNNFQVVNKIPTRGGIITSASCLMKN